jgi:hypothetical protein
MGVLFTYEKVTRCPFFTKMFSPFKRTKARNTTVFHMVYSTVQSWSPMDQLYFMKYIIQFSTVLTRL